MATKKRFSDVMVVSQAILLSGVTAFILGVLAENFKPTSCSYSNDNSPALGSAGLVFLLVSLIISVAALVYPYERKSVPVRALLQNKGVVFFSLLSLAISLTAAGLLLWATIAEARRKKFVDPSVSSCPSAKSGLFGGAAFLALDATLFWLVSLMLTLNVRNSILQGDEEIGVYGELAVRYSATALSGGVASNV